MIQWVTVDPATGDVIESLPGLRLESTLPVYVGKGDSVKCSIPIRGRRGRNLPQRWQIATEPNRTLLIAHYDDVDQTVLWGGRITNRRHGSGPAVELSAEPVDGWLATQYTGTVLGSYSVTARDKALVAADMLSPIVAAFHGRIDVTLTGELIDYTVTDADDKTCASVLTTLMGLGGVEYRIGWEWDADGCLVCVALVAPQIGSALPAINFGGVEWSTEENYAQGCGATLVTATATRTGQIRNQATAQASDLLAAGYLPVELRYTPDTGETSTAMLSQHASGRLPAVQQGTSSTTLTLRPDNDVRLNRDIQVGDVFSADLTNPDLPEANVTITARMLGFVAEADRTSGEIVRITPILQEV